MKDNPPSLYTSINEENIIVLVRTFYPKVLKDSVLSPFFIAKLGDDIQSKQWEEHLKLLIEFWKFAALGYEEYSGHPLQAHFNLEGLSREAFKAWITLFHSTVDTLYSADASEYFKEKSTNIAEAFIAKLKL